MIANAVFLHSKAGREEELAQRLDVLAEASRKDDGVLVYEVNRSASDAGQWFLYERYESLEHFERHRQNPVLRSFLNDMPKLLEGKLDVQTFDVVSTGTAVSKASK